MNDIKDEVWGRVRREVRDYILDRGGDRGGDKFAYIQILRKVSGGVNDVVYKRVVAKILDQAHIRVAIQIGAG